MPLTPRPLGFLASFDLRPCGGSILCTRSKSANKYSVKTLAIHAFSFELEQAASERFVTDLIIQPRVDSPDLMRIQPANIIDPNMILKLLSGLSSLLKEVRAEPYLLQMRFMWVLGEDLLDGHLPL